MKYLKKDPDTEAFVISGRKERKQKSSFHRPSLSV